MSNLRLDNYPYEGTESVSLGDGSQIPIQSQGSASFSSSQRIFTLKNILHSPLLTKNLLSVLQFCIDNHVYFEFHSNFFVVKDSQSSTVLLRGLVKDELYVLLATACSPSFQLATHLTVTASPSLVHFHLGHPSTLVEDEVRRHFLPSSKRPIWPISMFTMCLGQGPCAASPS